MESVLESHGLCESLELSTVRIGLETTEILWLVSFVGFPQQGESKRGRFV